VFSWFKGTYTVRRAQHPEDDVIHFWNPSSHSEVLVLLDNVLDMSLNWFRWTRSAVQMYFHNETTRDHQMFGIVLQRGSSQTIPEDSFLFRHQIAGQHAIAIFPRHWIEFVSWFQVKSKDSSFVPCLPHASSLNQINNLGSSLNWCPYFNRFAFEKGYYALWTKFDGNVGLVKFRRKMLI
jgi:hypothetical protein